MKNAAQGKYKLSEAQWQKTVIAAAQALGWLVHHVRPGMNRKGVWMTAVSGNSGFVDLLLCHEKTGDTLFVELKRDGVSVKDASQKRWGAALALQNEYAVWQPKDWEAVRLRLSRPRSVGCSWVTGGSLAEFVKPISSRTKQ